MKPWLVQVTLILSVLAVLLYGTWFAWQRWWSAEQFEKAMFAENWERANLLKSLGADSDTWFMENSYEILREAIDQDDHGKIEKLIRLGVIVDAPSPNAHFTPLEYTLAQTFNNRNANERMLIIQSLVAAGANIHHRSASNRQPIHFASEYGNADAAQYLISLGADVNAVDSSGKTPLDWAEEWSVFYHKQKIASASNKYDATVKVLKDAGGVRAGKHGRKRRENRILEITSETAHRPQVGRWLQAPDSAPEAVRSPPVIERHARV